MGWYQKLNNYFPQEEMKKKEQLEALLEQNPHYKKIETDQYLVLYGEYQDFIFVDYIIVDRKARGQGLGTKILEELKSKGKNLILEVEPIDADDPDTIKRKHFYLNNGFTQAKQITYYRDVGENNPELHPMELYYWSPQTNIHEEVIREQMVTAYHDIHHFNYKEYFDRKVPRPEALVQLSNTEPETRDSR